MNKHKKLLMLPAVLLVGGAPVAFSPVVSAHNRAQIFLPTCECIVVGSEKSVTLPDGSYVDLRPETPQDEIGTAFAANQGQSRIEIGGCS